ncbi:hypothetical protein DFH07DRAFT_822810 [Mycena maculata]|uniref:Uncharacterized protein n=1 Tax=Mycena maculata TaxID=230809 RepID=A0AAD7J1Q3_9AGAR|nr:hypothetical protein DFH07DRAFT_822810 [Mycena maculata]
MLENTLRFLNTVVTPKPAFTIPPSDPDPTHNFSTRNRRSANNLTSHASGTSATSWASTQRASTQSLAPVGTSTPRKPGRDCCCSCHLPASSASHAPPQHVSTSRSIRRTRFEEPSVSHRREPAVHDGSPIKYTSARESKSKSSVMNTTIASSARTRREELGPSVSEMGELRIRARAVKVEDRSGTYSRMKASWKSWTSPKPQAARLKRPTRPPPEVKKSLAPQKDRCGRSATVGTPQKTGCRTAKGSDTSFESMPISVDRKVGGRELRRSDGNIVSVNRFGWPLGTSRKSGKEYNNTESGAARPEYSPVKDCRPGPRASFEVDLSPIVEDIHSFPSAGNEPSNLESFSVLEGDRPEMITNGDQEQEYPDYDSRNFDHMNLSGSFMYQSTSCRGPRVEDPVADEEEPVPALVLTFPTPEPPQSPVFAPQSPFTVHKFVVAAASGDSTSACDQRANNLTVPALPRCTHCGFGFGFDFHDLEAPRSSTPCSFCEPQWLACKMWYQTRGNRLREPGAVRPAESHASSRAIVGKLGLPVGSHKGLGIGVVNELGQLDAGQAGVHAQAVGEGYSRFSNVVITDRTRTKRSAGAMVWKKVTRLFGTRERTVNNCPKPLDVDNLGAEPERRRKALDLRRIGPASVLVGI